MFGNDDSAEPIHGWIYIEVNQTKSDKPITYNIKDTVFEKLMFRDPVISAINLFHGSLTLNVQQSSNIHLNVTGMKPFRVFQDKMKFYIFRHNLHQTCSNDFSNVKQTSV